MFPKAYEYRIKSSQKTDEYQENFTRDITIEPIHGHIKSELGIENITITYRLGERPQFDIKIKKFYEDNRDALTALLKALKAKNPNDYPDCISSNLLFVNFNSWDKEVTDKNVQQAIKDFVDVFCNLEAFHVSKKVGEEVEKHVRMHRSGRYLCPYA